MLRASIFQSICRQRSATKRTSMLSIANVSSINNIRCYSIMSKYQKKTPVRRDSEDDEIVVDAPQPIQLPRTRNAPSTDPFDMANRISSRLMKDVSFGD
jgi:hypothetical protein